MGIQDLQAYLENEGISVDLFRIGRNHSGGFRLVLDAEGCLDRLYGGYFSDWACGGQWARCVQFFLTLKTALAEHHVTVCICFNGSHPTGSNGTNLTPPPLWLQQQITNRQKINSVLRHISSKGTPPPKVWWVPPAGLHSCLRNALRHLNVPMMVSIDDHHHEVVTLCRERGYAGIVGSSAEYLIFQPPRYFCSSRLKLTYRSSLETKEYLVHQLPEILSVSQDRLCIFAALLGNYTLTEQHLADFYKRLSNNQKKQLTGEVLINAVASYVNEFPSKDLDAFCVDLFGTVNDSRSPRFKQSVQYYINGTKEAFLKYKNTPSFKSKNKKFGAGAAKEADLDTSQLASEINPPNVDFKLGGISCSNEWSEETIESIVERKNTDVSSIKSPNNANSSDPAKSTAPFPIEVLRTCTERHSKGLMAPSLLTILTQRQITLPVLLEDENHREIPSIHHFFRPIRQNVYAILFNMHHFHFMATRGKEGEKTTPPPPISVAEWIYSRRNPGKNAEMVQGVMLDWPVPTVQRLWFGITHDDKCRRLRAFLTCMKSDTHLMLNTSYVPQHLLILATVLRYIMRSPLQCIRPHELDAFLATACSSDLMNPLLLQEMILSNVTVRGVQLAAILMAGIDAALLANDACGAPLYWAYTSHWMFFDGKLFQQKLAKANTVKNLTQLCDNQVEVVMKVERMRHAILEGLEIEGSMIPLMNPSMSYPPPNMLNWASTAAKGRGGLNRGGGGRLEIAGVVVGQWGANYARSAAAPARYPTTSQLGYSTYSQPTYGARGRGFGRGRAMSSSGRGALVRRTKNRSTKPIGRNRNNGSNSFNGKSSNCDDGKNGTGDSSNSDEVIDSTTDIGDNEQGSDNGDSDPAGKSSPGDADHRGNKSGARSGKLVKKPVMKGKKKTLPKNDTHVKSDELSTNGQSADNFPASGMKNKMPAKPAANIVNGSNDSNGDHKEACDSHADN